MKVADLIRQLQRLQDAQDLEVFVVTRSGPRLDPTVVYTVETEAYVGWIDGSGRSAIIDTCSLRIRGKAASCG